jgi:hypothetical protein
LHNLHIGLTDTEPIPGDHAPTFDLIGYRNASAAHGEIVTIATDTTVQGRFLILQIPGADEVLTLCEVQVYKRLLYLRCINWSVIQIRRIRHRLWEAVHPLADQGIQSLTPCTKSKIMSYHSGNQLLEEKLHELELMCLFSCFQRTRVVWEASQRPLSASSAPWECVVSPSPSYQTPKRSMSKAECRSSIALCIARSSNADHCTMTPRKNDVCSTQSSFPLRNSVGRISTKSSGPDTNIEVDTI